MSGANQASLGLLPGFLPPLQSLDVDAGLQGSQLAGTAFVEALALHGHHPVEQFVARRDISAAVMVAEHLRPRAGEPEADTRCWRVSPHDALPEALRCGRLQALHTVAAPLLDALCALRERFAPGPIPLTAVTHGLSSPGILYPRLQALLLSESLPCDAIVCISRAARQALQRLLDLFAARLEGNGVPPARFAGELPIIPWGVDVEMFSPGERKVAREELRLPVETVLVLCHGRLTPGTKADLVPLLLALRRLRAAGSAPTLVLSGADSAGYGARVLARAQELGIGSQVLLMGNVPYAALPDLYRACDIFVSISDTTCESLGLTLLEASASGLPVVASDWNGYRDVVRDGDTGCLIPTRWTECDAAYAPLMPLDSVDGYLLAQAQSVQVDVPALAQALGRLTKDNSLRCEMGARGRAWILEEYTWPRVIATYEQLWDNLSRIAASTALQRVPSLLSGVSDLFGVFSPGASRLLAEDDMICLTIRGQSWLEAGSPQQLVPLMANCLSADDLVAIVRGLSVTERMGWAEARRWCQLERSMDDDAAAAHLLWLIKYGYASID